MDDGPKKWFTFRVMVSACEELITLISAAAMAACLNTFFI
jgi:hypothetical protein